MSESTHEDKLIYRITVSDDDLKSVGASVENAAAAALSRALGSVRAPAFSAPQMPGIAQLPRMVQMFSAAVSRFASAATEFSGRKAPAILGGSKPQGIDKPTGTATSGSSAAGMDPSRRADQLFAAAVSRFSAAVTTFAAWKPGAMAPASLMGGASPATHGPVFSRSASKEHSLQDVRREEVERVRVRQRLTRQHEKPNPPTPTVHGGIGRPAAGHAPAMPWLPSLATFAARSPIVEARPTSVATRVVQSLAGPTAVNPASVMPSSVGKLTPISVNPLAAAAPSIATQVAKSFGSSAVGNITSKPPGVPDVKRGHARFYHGGDADTGLGSGARWFSPDVKYAAGYAAKSKSPISYVDLPESHPLVQKSFDDSGTSTKSPYDSNEFPEDISRTRKPHPAPLNWSISGTPPIYQAPNPTVASQVAGSLGSADVSQIPKPVAPGMTPTIRSVSTGVPEALARPMPLRQVRESLEMLEVAHKNRPTPELAEEIAKLQAQLTGGRSRSTGKSEPATDAPQASPRPGTAAVGSQVSASFSAAVSRFVAAVAHFAGASAARAPSIASILPAATGSAQVGAYRNSAASLVASAISIGGAGGAGRGVGTGGLGGRGGAGRPTGGGGIGPNCCNRIIQAIHSASARVVSAIHAKGVGTAAAPASPTGSVGVGAAPSASPGTARPRTRRSATAGRGNFISTLLGGRRGVGLGPNSVTGQFVRSIGFGSAQRGLGGFVSHFAGNLPGSLPALARRAMSPAGGALTRGVLARQVGGAAMRGVGGAMLGNAGAAIAGMGAVAGPALAAVAGVKMLADAVGHAVAAVNSFGKALVTGNMSDAVHGVISGLQAGAKGIGGSVALVGAGLMLINPVVGGVVAALGLFGGYIGDKVLGVLHHVVDGLDGLVSSLGKFSPIVAAQARMLEVKTMFFQRQMAGVFQPLMSAWLDMKSMFLDVLSILGNALKPAMKGLGNILAEGTKWLRSGFGNLAVFMGDFIRTISDTLFALGKISAEQSKAGNEFGRDLRKAGEEILKGGAGSLSDALIKYNQDFIAALRGSVKPAIATAPVPRAGPMPGVFPQRQRQAPDDAPRFASGGIVRSPTWGLVGERSDRVPEGIVPLLGRGQSIPLGRDAGGNVHAELPGGRKIPATFSDSPRSMAGPLAGGQKRPSMFADGGIVPGFTPMGNALAGKRDGELENMAYRDPGVSKAWGKFKELVPDDFFENFSTRERTDYLKNHPDAEKAGNAYSSLRDEALAELKRQRDGVPAPAISAKAPVVTMPPPAAMMGNALAGQTDEQLKFKVDLDPEVKSLFDKWRAVVQTGQQAETDAALSAWRVASAEKLEVLKKWRDKPPLPAAIMASQPRVQPMALPSNPMAISSADLLRMAGQDPLVVALWAKVELARKDRGNASPEYESAYEAWSDARAAKNDQLVNQREAGVLPPRPTPRMPLTAAAPSPLLQAPVELVRRKPLIQGPKHSPWEERVRMDNGSSERHRSIQMSGSRNIFGSWRGGGRGGFTPRFTRGLNDARSGVESQNRWRDNVRRPASKKDAQPKAGVVPPRPAAKVPLPKPMVPQALVRPKVDADSASDMDLYDQAMNDPNVMALKSRWIEAAKSTGEAPRATGPLWQAYSHAQDEKWRELKDRRDARARDSILPPIVPRSRRGGLGIGFADIPARPNIGPQSPIIGQTGDESASPVGGRDTHGRYRTRPGLTDTGPESPYAKNADHGVGIAMTPWRDDDKPGSSRPQPSAPMAPQTINIPAGTSGGTERSRRPVTDYRRLVHEMIRDTHRELNAEFAANPHEAQRCASFSEENQLSRFM